jgi:hypothetical protein
VDPRAGLDDVEQRKFLTPPGFENRVLKRMSGPKRGEIVEGWEKLHNEELHILHSLPK